MWRFVSLGCAVIAALAVTFASTGSQTHGSVCGDDRKRVLDGESEQPLVS